MKECPAGRFVGEFGGLGSCAASVVAIAAVLARRGIDIGQVNPWYYPTAQEYRSRLEAGGFAVDYAELVPLPTPLSTGMMGFLETFCEAFFRLLAASDRRAAMDEVVKLVRPAMCDREGHWTMDFVRVRFAAHLRT